MPERLPGVLVVSLDFELFWGVRDTHAGPDYERNVRGAPRAVEAILQAFERASVHATWAVVGFLFLENKAELEKQRPRRIPRYRNSNLSPYAYIGRTPDLHPPLHFAPRLIDAILNIPGQEVGSHTFSHYYCLEAGQDEDTFREDLRAARRAADSRRVKLSSFVFPRNQCNPAYLPVLREMGISSYRGSEDSWGHRNGVSWKPKAFRRAFRLVDSYVNLSGHHVFDREACRDGEVWNIRASRFLRPYRPGLASLDALRLRRITQAMDQAAARGEIFHLWWHPHNFGRHLEGNMAFLNEVLSHYRKLHERHGMLSLNMGELADSLESEVV